MKLKLSYIYVGLFIVAITTLIIFSSGDETKSSNIPEDEIHNNILDKPVSPSSNNVSAEFTKMMEELGDYVSKNPEDTLKMLEFADLLAASHKEAEAEIYYKRILDIDKSRTDILTKIASLKYNAGNYTEARSYISKIIAINPDHLQAIFNMGIIEEKLGDVAAAKKQWEDLIANHPNSKMSDMARDAIERLKN